MLIVTPIVGFGICYMFCNFMSILVLQHLDREERAGCFTLFVFLVSCDCCVALLHDACGLSVTLVFLGHTHLLFWLF